MTFAEFMEEALYGEGGYYAAESPVGRDFVTGSSLSPLFGRATARVLGRLADALGRPADYLEAGFGGGEHLRSLLAAWPEATRGRVLVWDRVDRPSPPPSSPLAGLAEVETSAIAGLVFSYELFDALPVHRLIGGSDGKVAELWVDLDASGGFRYAEREPSDAALAELLGGIRLAPGQIADVAPDWAPLYRSLARALSRGLLVTCDYGFATERLFDVRVRRHGTLACYRRQRVHRDPFVDVGRQDLTAHVDFGALARAGVAEGLTTVAFTRQARWLLSAGLFAELEGAPATARAEALALLDGEGMGEEIRVLVQARNIDGGDVLDLETLGGESLR